MITSAVRLRSRQAVAAAGALLLAGVACERAVANRPDSLDARAAAASTPSTPAYLRAAFGALDTLVTGSRRDSLRTLPIDSAYHLRTGSLLREVTSLAPAWSASLVGDTVAAHGVMRSMTPIIVLDLYQQHVRGEPLDVAGAVRRTSPSYVSRIPPLAMPAPPIVTLPGDFDGEPGADRLIEETRPWRGEGGDSTAGPDVDEDLRGIERRLALYLDAPGGSRTPAWALRWDSEVEGRVSHFFTLPGGGSLLVVQYTDADAGVTVVLLARAGKAVEVLEHHIDYGEGDFTIEERDGRIVAEATLAVQLGDRRVVATRSCSSDEWPASVLTFDDTTQRFAVQRETCVRRYYR